MKTSAKKLKRLLNKDIIDIIMFGSFVKGKIKPNDIDIAIISNEYKKEKKENIQKIIPNSDVQFVRLADYDKYIWLTLIKEGFSVKHNKYLHEIFRIDPVVLYKYSLKDLTNSKKVMFERALKNFKNIEKLSNRVVLVPVSTSSEFEDLLRYWNIDIDSKEYHLLPLVRKSN